MATSTAAPQACTRARRSIGTPHKQGSLADLIASVFDPASASSARATPPRGTPKSSCGLSACQSPLSRGAPRPLPLQPMSYVSHQPGASSWRPHRRLGSLTAASAASCLVSHRSHAVHLGQCLRGPRHQLDQLHQPSFNLAGALAARAAPPHSTVAALASVLLSRQQLSPRPSTLTQTAQQPAWLTLTLSPKSASNFLEKNHPGSSTWSGPLLMTLALGPSRPLH